MLYKDVLHFALPPDGFIHKSGQQQSCRPHPHSPAVTTAWLLYLFLEKTKTVHLTPQTVTGHLWQVQKPIVTLVSKSCSILGIAGRKECMW